MNNKERQLIIKSITHWQEDAIDMFDKGFHFNGYNDTWIKNDIIINNRLGSKDCPLCIHYKMKCSKCLWYFYSRAICYDPDQEYDIFILNPTEENALKVIEKLWRIGNNL